MISPQQIGKDKKDPHPHQDNAQVYFIIEKCDFLSLNKEFALQKQNWFHYVLMGCDLDFNKYGSIHIYRVYTYGFNQLWIKEKKSICT